MAQLLLFEDFVRTFYKDAANKITVYMQQPQVQLEKGGLP
jgi:hypothetical protein